MERQYEMVGEWKTLKENENIFKKKKRVTTSSSWKTNLEMMSRFLRHFESKSEAAKAIGYSPNVFSQWKKSGKVPTVAVWAVKGKLNHLDGMRNINDEIDLPIINPPRPFTREQLIQMIQRCSDDAELVQALAKELSNLS